MADIQDIIVGAGATAGGTFVLGRVTYVGQVSPAVISTSFPAIANDGVVLGILSIPNSAGVYSTIVGATEMLRVQGGAIISGAALDSVQIGRAAVANGIGTGAIAIGAGAVTGGGQSTIVGYLASSSGAAGVVLGISAALTGNGGCIGIAIGGSANANVTTNGGGAGTAIAIGDLSVAGDGDTILGSSATGTQTQNNNYNVIIGTAASQTLSRGNAVVIGRASTSAATLGVVIGSNSAIGSGTKNVVVGQGSSVSGAFTNCVVLGQGSTSGASQQIVIGVGGLSIGANTAQIGTPGTQISTFVLGQGDTVAAPPVTTIRFTNSSGADSPAGALVFHAPLSTGNGSPAVIVLRVGKQIGAGATLQIATDVLTIGDRIVTVAAGATFKLGNAYVAGVTVPTGSIVITDSAGQAYRISAVI